MKAADLGRGWHKITNEQHQNLEAVTSTSVKMFDASPFRYRHSYIIKDRPAEPYKAAFKVGTAVHMHLLEPHLAAEKILVCDYGATTKKFADFIKDCVPYLVEGHPENTGGRFRSADGSHYYVFTTDEMAVINQMVENAKKHKMFSGLHKHAEAEITGLAEEETPDGTHWLTCRGDLRGKLPNDMGYFVDIKTIDTINEHAITYQMTTLGYLIQQAHYMHVGNKIDLDKYKMFYFFFMEKQFPYECALVHMDLTEEENSNLNSYYQKMLNALLTARVSNVFPPFDNDKLKQLKLPIWYANKIRNA